MSTPTITTLSINRQPPGWLHPILNRLHHGNYVVVVAALDSEPFQFDHAQARSLAGQPIVVIDMLEYGPKSYANTHLLGVNSPEVIGEQYAPLDEWLRGQGTVAYFKREMNSFHLSYNVPVHPIDLLAHVPPQSLTKDQFMARVGQVFFNYGYSHEDRKRLHAAMQTHFGPVVNALDAAEMAAARRIPFHYAEQRPHWCRYPMDRLIALQGQCLISCVLAGNGNKTFRDAEAIANAVPAVPDTGIIRAIPFTDENSIRLPFSCGTLDIEPSISILKAALQMHEVLWSKAQQAHDMHRRMQVENYVAEFINPKIREAL